MRYLLVILSMIFCLPAVTFGGYKEDFEKEFMSKPWAGEQAEEDVCIECHSSEKMKPEFRTITEEWRASLHAQNRISCSDCHGGDTKDVALAMSRQRGFLGTPKYTEVPEFCGKCHIGILKNYLDSGHGKALKASAKGPNCVSCHGSHNIQRASIDIINEQRCSKCHSYDRAKVMKQALFVTEKKMGELENGLGRLRNEGVFDEEDEKSFFNSQAEFRALFHTVDVSLVKDRTDEFTKKLNLIEKEIEGTFRELHFRKNLSAFFMLLFGAMGLVIFLLSKTPKD
jgi:nitrate/TMAO reductase-like tetraheme cytochrome c subunit